jgi:protein TonB
MSRRRGLTSFRVEGSGGDPCEVQTSVQRRAMSFVQPQKNTARFSAGIGVAVVFHIVLVWALMNGLGRKVMQVINAPIETEIIEEVKPPPPPPKVIEMPPPPKFTPPPPAFVPPPEVQVQAPPPPQSTITATAAEPSPAPPLAAPRVEAPPARVSASVACSNYAKVMGDAGFPREATRAGLDEGSALIQFTLGANGEVRDITALRASHSAFAKGSMRLVAEYKCAGQGHDITVQVPFVFKSN